MSGKLISRKKYLKKCASFEEQKGASYIQGNIYFDIAAFRCLLSTKPCLRFLLICFAWEIKGFCQSSVGNEVDFRDIMNHFPNILAKNQYFKKLRQGFVDERALITTTLISSCHWKILVPFAKEKTCKRIFNTNSELSQNRKEKQIMSSKTTVNWLFNDIWCYLGCFDWKIGVFQQTVLRRLLYS